MSTITGQLVYNLPGVENTVTSDNFIKGLIGMDKSYPIQGTVTKLGIQGEPGLKFYINEQPFYLGRTGIFEVDNVEIKTLTITPPDQYTYDEAATITAQQEVLKVYGDKSNFENIEAYNIKEAPDKEELKWDEDKIIAYHKQINDFITEMQSVETNYTLGLNGVYKRSDGSYGTILIDYRSVNEEKGEANNE